MNGAIYPSGEWFEASAKHIKSGDSSADLVVEHHCEMPDGAILIHQQAFSSSNNLIGWGPGPLFGEPHLLLKRTAEADAGDLFGSSTPSLTAIATSIEMDGITTSILGHEAFKREGLAQFAGKTPPVDVSVKSTASPFGDIAVGLRMHASGKMEILDEDTIEPVHSVEGTWDDYVSLSLRRGIAHALLMEGKLHFGTNDLLLPLYWQGFYDWPRSDIENEWAKRFHVLLLKYRDCRVNPGYSEAVATYGPQ